MNKDFRNASALNLSVILLSSIVTLLSYIFTDECQGKMGEVFLGVIFVLVVLEFFVTFVGNISHNVKIIFFTISHIVFIACTFICYGKDSFVLPLITISQLVILCYYSIDAMKLHLVLSEILMVCVCVLDGIIIKGQLTLFEHVVGMSFLLVQFIVFRLMITTRQQSLKNEAELKQSSNDLVKVIDRKCEDALVATRSKTDFLANMSHEIRTPINAVIGLNELILREATDKNIISYAHDVKNAGSSLLNIVNDILDLSKIEAGKMELIPVSYDVSVLINELSGMVSVNAENKGLSFKLDVDPNLPSILYGDEIRIKQIIANLLSNAVKYTQKGYFTLSLSYRSISTEAINLTVCVEDSGIGMREESIHKLFAPYERIEEERNRKIEGTGLGMSIVRRSLEMMGTDLKVESEYGSGSRFSFTIRQEVKNWEPVGDLSESIKNLKLKEENYRVKFRAPNASVLVVDDMLLNITVFKGLLKNTCVQIDEATGGEKALEMCRNKKYDIIFLDHLMPGMNGVETFKRLRSDTINPNCQTHVVALTANAISGARDEYMEHGFDDYLSKPIDPILLEQMMMKYLPDDLIDIVDLDLDVDVDAVAVADAVEEDCISDEASTEEEKIMQLMQALDEIPVIDTNLGLSFSGDEELYTSIVADFYETVEERAGMIKDYFDSGDIQNYTIQVHALKSSAKMIGDQELSDMALELELAGKDENIGLINEKTETLLDRYHHLEMYLATVFGSEESKEDNANQEMISDERLSECIAALKQYIDDFDFDMAEGVMKELSEYRMPESFAENFKKLKKMLSDMDYEDMGELLETI